MPFSNVFKRTELDHDYQEMPAGGTEGSPSNFQMR